MCYHKQDIALKETLESHYQIPLTEAHHLPIFYDNGFDHNASLVITQDKPKEFQRFTWGLIPWWVKTKQEALEIRIRTLNCVSEEMFDKASFRDSLKDGKRCLIPCTGFFEWRHFNKGKNKYPYFVHLKETSLFSLAGLWSEWTDRTTGEVLQTYTVLTTKANELMSKIHNSKLRMPIILAKEFERDWLNPNLTKDDVIALSKPFDTNKMEAYPISKMITDRKVDDKNVAEISKPFDYPELALLDS